MSVLDLVNQLCCLHFTLAWLEIREISMWLSSNKIPAIQDIDKPGTGIFQVFLFLSTFSRVFRSHIIDSSRSCRGQEERWCLPVAGGSQGPPARCRGVCWKQPDPGSMASTSLEAFLFVFMSRTAPNAKRRLRRHLIRTYQKKKKKEHNQPLPKHENCVWNTKLFDYLWDSCDREDQKK